MKYKVGDIVIVRSDIPKVSSYSGWVGEIEHINPKLKYPYRVCFKSKYLAITFKENELDIPSEEVLLYEI